MRRHSGTGRMVLVVGAALLLCASCDTDEGFAERYAEAVCTLGEFCNSYDEVSPSQCRRHEAERYRQRVASCKAYDATNEDPCLAALAAALAQEECGNQPSLHTDGPCGAMAIDCGEACPPLPDIDDPRMPAECGAGEGCYWDAFFGFAVCQPDASESGGALGDACTAYNGCDPGLVCSASDGAAGVCADWCTVEPGATIAKSCPSPTQTCVALPGGEGFWGTCM